MNERSPAFQFYPKDFLSSSKVDRMSMTERGIYVTLMCRYWLDGDLPSDLTELAAMVRMKAKQFERIWAQGPLHLCFVSQGGRLIQERLEDERLKQAEFRRRQSDRGKASGRARQRLVEPAFNGPGEPNTNGPVKPDMNSSSSSAICNLQTAVSKSPRPLGARTGLLKPPRPDAAFDGGRVWVLHKTHADFMALRNGNERELLDWYAVVAAEWANDPREPGANMFKFWEARYAERWPVAQNARAAKLPAWAQK